MIRTRWLAAWLALPLGSCLFETATPAPGDDHRLDYTVTVQEAVAAQASVGKMLSGAVPPSGDGARVDVRIRSWPDGEPKLFQAPVFYSDNPAYPLKGLTAADLTVRDRRGNRLTARDTILSGLFLDGNFIVLPDSAHAISYRVDLDPRDAERFGAPIPGTGKGVDLIDGAYFFILPLLGRDFPSQWRTPARYTVEFTPVAGRTLTGSDTRIALSTNYELMFVRAAYGALKAKTFPMRNHEVTVYSTSSASLDMDAFAALLGKCIALVEDSLLPLPTYRYFAGENPQFWGIEGVQGYWFKSEAQALPVVHVHELAHTFVGIYHSDYDDPWWKEGVTNYLGLLLSLQGGLIGDTAFAGDMLILRDSLPAVRQHGLASAYVRNHLFPALDSAFNEPYVPENFTGLVYGKGGQAAMILDRYLLERSGGKASLFDLIRALIRGHGSAFHRADLIASVDALTGGGSAEFLGSLLDRAAPLGADSVVSTYRAMRSLGRFGPGGGKSPILGVDPPGKRSAGVQTHPSGNPAGPSHNAGAPEGSKL